MQNSYEIAREYYEEMLRYEDISLQNNNNGFHGKRVLCSNLEEVYNLEHNHRKIGIVEVIWDIDCRVSNLSHNIADRISSGLIKDKMGHSIWDTSRTLHIHAFFDGLSHLEREQRKELKKAIIKHYAEPYMAFLDLGVCSELRTIRDFNGRHEITGKPKQLVYFYKPQAGNILNLVPSRILSDFRQKHKTINEAPIVAVKPQNRALQGFEDYQRFIEFAQKTPFLRQGMGKNNLYFKNIAIAVFRLGISQAEARQIFKNVVLCCRPHRADSMINWLKWCRAQKRELKVNWGEVKSFYGRVP